MTVPVDINGRRRLTVTRLSQVFGAAQAEFLDRLRATPMSPNTEVRVPGERSLSNRATAIESGTPMSTMPRSPSFWS